MRDKKRDNENGTCYQDAFRFAMDTPSNCESDVRLVHGTVYSTHFKCRINHAWVEMGGGDVVIDSTINFLGRATKYYDFAEAEAAVKYTKREMSKAAVRTGHFGPWESEKKLSKKVKKDLTSGAESCII